MDFILDPKLDKWNKAHDLLALVAALYSRSNSGVGGQATLTNSRGIIKMHNWQKNIILMYQWKCLSSGSRRVPYFLVIFCKALYHLFCSIVIELSAVRFQSGYENWLGYAI